MEYRSKDSNHVEWAKALKELYVPGLRDYVKGHYPLGPVWSATGKSIVSAPPKASTTSTTAPPPPPSASLFTSEPPKASSSQPKAGMSAIFQEINSGKPVTAGNTTPSFLVGFMCYSGSYGINPYRIEKGYR